MYEPLYIDELLEQPQPPPPRWSFRRVGFNLNRFSKWLDQRVPLMLYCEPLRGRKSAEAQLAAREHFPESAWTELGHSPESVRELLASLADYLEWPNRNFVPDDPLQLVLLHGCYDLGLVTFFALVRRTYRIPFSQEDLDRICEKGATLRYLVGDILERTAQVGEAD